MAARPDHNAAPDRKVLCERKDFRKDNAPGKGGNDGKNYDD